MPQILLPSFSLVLNSDHDSSTMRDYDRAEHRELQVPMFAPLTSEESLMRTIDFRVAPAFITYKRDYFPHEQDAASLFGDAPEKKLKFFQRHLNAIVEKVKGLSRL